MYRKAVTIAVFPWFLSFYFGISTYRRTALLITSRFRLKWIFIGILLHSCCQPWAVTVCPDSGVSRVVLPAGFSKVIFVFVAGCWIVEYQIFHSYSSHICCTLKICGYLENLDHSFGMWCKLFTYFILTVNAEVIHESNVQWLKSEGNVLKLLPSISVGVTFIRQKVKDLDVSSAMWKTEETSETILRKLLWSSKYSR